MNDIQVIDGKVTIDVTLASGQKQTVNVIEIPVGRWSQALEYALPDKEAEFIELVTTQETGWTNKLSPASYNELAETAREVNSHFFAAFERRKRAEMALVPESVINQTIKRSVQALR